MSAEITQAGTIFFTAYQGLKFVDMAALRGELAPTGAKFRVERNAILDHAIRQAKIEGADAKLFQGPTAVAVGGDIAAVAKALVDFQKKQAALKLRALVPKKKICPSWPARCTTRLPNRRKSCKLRSGILPTLSKLWKKNKANNVCAAVGRCENLPFLGRCARGFVGI